MACGALSYESGIFHLVTHAFFKAMLFLCAGVVIHAVHEQDITKMGGLRKYMPVTYILFWIGSLAIMGIYPFAGFYSKDLILESVFMAPNGQLPFIIGLCSAFLTAVYSMKIIVMVFHGNSQNDHHAHEGPLVMVLPLLLLAVGSVCSGWFLVSYFSIHEHNEAVEQIKYLPMAVGLSGMIFGFIIYQWKIAAKLARTFRFLHQILANKYFIDEIYDIVFIRTTFMLSRVSKSIDAAIDFVPNSSADISQIFAGIISRLQSGYIFSYVFYILLGLLGVMFWWIVRWLI
jgi:NADH-quinone oxidoreductase subunit L